MSAFLISPKQFALIAVHAVAHRPTSFELWVAQAQANNAIEAISCSDMPSMEAISQLNKDSSAMDKQRVLVRALVRANIESLCSRYGYADVLSDTCVSDDALKAIALRLDKKQGSALDHSNFINSLTELYSFFVDGEMLEPTIKKMSVSISTQQYKVYVKTLAYQSEDYLMYAHSLAKVFHDFETMDFDGAWYSRHQLAFA